MVNGQWSMISIKSDIYQVNHNTYEDIIWIQISPLQTQFYNANLSNWQFYTAKH